MNKILAGLSLALASLAWADAVDDPWPLLPALPTGCYSRDDTFADQAWAVNETLANAMQQQTDINNAVLDQWSNLDPAEQQQRFMDFMMKNPQEATRAMEAMYGAESSAAIQQGVMASAERAAGLDGELSSLQAEYAAAVAASDAAVPAPPGAKGDDWCNVSNADYEVYVGRYNAAYESMCPRWWGVDGPFHAWMGRWRSHLDENSSYESQIEETRRFNLEVYGIPVENYRSTVEIDAAQKFLGMAAGVFGGRRHEPSVRGERNACI